jgi:hypothetical protein
LKTGLRLIGAFLIVLAAAMPASAQPSSGPLLSFRVYGLGADDYFAAKNTFNAVFGTHKGMLWGGGIEVVHSSGIFVDIEASQVKKTGQRVFVNGGQVFPLGIPLTATITPVDFMGGYRLKLGDSPVVIPYAAAGVSSYGYKESSDFSEPTEDVDTKKTGFTWIAGAEVHVVSFLSVSADVQDTRVKGIIGSSGASQQYNENDLGGFALRFRVIVGGR